MRAAVNAIIPLLNPQRMEDTVKIAMAETKTERAPTRSATHPLIGMKTASISKYAVIPIFRSTGLTWKDFPICGRAVAMTVPSRFSIKKAVATRMEIDVDFWKGDAIILSGLRVSAHKSLYRRHGARLAALYFALATSGSGIASVGKFMGYGWYG